MSTLGFKDPFNWDVKVLDTVSKPDSESLLVVGCEATESWDKLL